MDKHETAAIELLDQARRDNAAHHIGLHHHQRLAVARLFRRISKLEEAAAHSDELQRRIDAVLEEIEGCVDVDDGDDRPQPNIFMRVQLTLTGE